jgi:poly(A) polymerase
MADKPNAGAVLDVPPIAKELGTRFAEAGHELYLVGGMVRDMLLGRETPDLDFATSAHPHETTRLLGRWADRRYLVGARFGTVGALKDGRRIEITTFREEVYAAEHRKPSVTFGKDILTDLSRRDFTMNAMALQLPEGTFVDPYGGARALAERSLDTPLEPEAAFSEDPLRMVRAARFVAQLDVNPADRVIEGISAMRDRLEIVSAERIRDELDKLLLAEFAPKGLALLVATKLSDEFLPELSALELEQDPVHRHKDVLRHTYAVVAACEPDLVLRLAALLHDIGKPATREFQPGGGVSFHHHEVVGAKMARKRLRALKFSKEIVQDVSQLVFLHLRFHGYGKGEWTDSAVRRYVTDAGDLLPRLHKLVRADCTTRNKRKAAALQATYDDLERRIATIQEQEDLDRVRPDLNGEEIMRILGLKPGPDVGKAWTYLKELRLDRGPLEHDDAVAELKKWAAENGIG